MMSCELILHFVAEEQNVLLALMQELNYFLLVDHRRIG